MREQLKLTNAPIFSIVKASNIAVMRQAEQPVSANSPTINETQPLLTTVVSVLPWSVGLPDSHHQLRLALSSWFVLRSDQPPALLVPAGQLGGSQAGLRIVAPLKPLSPNEDVALSAKVTSAINPVRESEFVLGIGVRHRGLISGEVNLEQRFKLTRGGRNALSLTANVGGSDIPVSKKISVSGYAQGGVVGIKSKDLFADLAVSVDRDLAKVGASRIAGGLGIWAAAQPGVARLDIGPRLTAKIPLGGGGLRLSADYRFRIGGNARPQSGPSISISHFF